MAKIINEIKSKIFVGTYNGKIDETINAWLIEKNITKIINVTQSTTGNRIIILVFYQKNLLTG